MCHRPSDEDEAEQMKQEADSKKQRGHYWYLYVMNVMFLPDNVIDWLILWLKRRRSWFANSVVVYLKQKYYKRSTSLNALSVYCTFPVALPFNKHFIQFLPNVCKDNKKKVFQRMKVAEKLRKFHLNKDHSERGRQKSTTIFYLTIQQTIRRHLTHWWRVCVASSQSAWDGSEQWIATSSARATEIIHV